MHATQAQAGFAFTSAESDQEGESVPVAVPRLVSHSGSHASHWRGVCHRVDCIDAAKLCVQNVLLSRRTPAVRIARRTPRVGYDAGRPQSWKPYPSGSIPRHFLAECRSVGHAPGDAVRGLPSL